MPNMTLVISRSSAGFDLSGEGLTDSMDALMLVEWARLYLHTCVDVACRPKIAAKMAGLTKEAPSADIKA